VSTSPKRNRTGTEIAIRLISCPASGSCMRSVQLRPMKLAELVI
jgi:hypothetical protein